MLYLRNPEDIEKAIEDIVNEQAKMAGGVSDNVSSEGISTASNSEEIEILKYIRSRDRKLWFERPFHRPVD